MMQAIKKNVLPELAAGLLALLFGYAAASKLMQYPLFVSQLKHSQLPGWAAPALAWALPVAELIIALLLAIAKTRGIALALSGLLMLFFTLYLAGMLLFSKDLPCSCGGILGALSWQAHLVFNLCFLLLAIAGYRQYRGQ